MVVRLAIRETPDASKLPPPSDPEKGKGLMMSQGLVAEKRLVLLCEEPQYAFRQLSIIKGGNYEDLGNHTTEAIEETSLFSLAQEYIHPSFPSVMLFLHFSNPCF